MDKERIAKRNFSLAVTLVFVAAMFSFYMSPSNSVSTDNVVTGKQIVNLDACTPSEIGTSAKSKKVKVGDVPTACPALRQAAELDAILDCEWRLSRKQCPLVCPVHVQSLLPQKIQSGCAMNSYDRDHKDRAKIRVDTRNPDAEVTIIASAMYKCSKKCSVETFSILSNYGS